MYVPLISTNANFIGGPFGGDPCYTWFLYKLEIHWPTPWIDRGIPVHGVSYQLASYLDHIVG